MTPFWRDIKWRLRAVALIVALLLVGLLNALAPTAFPTAEALGGDLLWRTAASSAPERRLVVVDIDEASLRAIGPWPWPRARQAELSLALSRNGALVQALDINFADAKDGDAQLADAWAQSAVVISQLLSLDPEVSARAGLVLGELESAGCPKFAPRSFGYYGTADSLAVARPTVGHISPRSERDGVIRRVPALICHEGRAYPNLALAAMWRAAQPTALPESTSGPKPDWVWHAAALGDVTPGALSPAGWLTSESLPGLVVPVDVSGDMRVPYRLERRAIVAVSAADVLAGRVGRDLLDGAVVLVGATAFGGGDSVSTPLATVAAGMEVHAQLLAGLLDRRLPFEPVQWGGYQLLGFVLIGLALVAAVGAGGRFVKRLLAVGALIAALSWAGSAVALWQFSLWLPWAAMALFALLASVALAAAEHALANLQTERVSAHLGAYLPVAVAERLMVTDPTGLLQVEQREVSVLMADIRNFSSFAAHRPAAETASLLHEFCCIGVRVVERHGGVVENVVGDSILAVWAGGPGRDNHQTQALMAAKDFLNETRELLMSNQPVEEGNVVQPLAMGIGLESGIAIVGSFGPANRRAHAALGEPVSVASRLQRMTGDLSLPVLIGPRFAAALPSADVEPMGEYLLEGFGSHHQLYAPAGWTELVAVDPRWAISASSADRYSEASKWGAWADSASTPIPRTLSNIGSPIGLRDA